MRPPDLPPAMIRLLDEIPEPVSVLDGRGRFLHRNRTLVRLTGWKNAQLRGKSPGSYIGRKLWRGILAEIDRRGHFRGLVTTRTASGETKDVELTSFPMRTIPGVGPLYMNFLRDAATRPAEEQLRFQKALLETQAEQSPEGILVVSAAGKMISFNRRFVEMWGLPAKVVASRSDRLAIQSVLDKLADPEQFRRRVAYLYRHPARTVRDEIALKDGRVFIRNSSPIRGPAGENFGRVWYFHDVTAQKDVERRLRQAADETADAYRKLRRAQDQLVRNEKLTAVGMLVSGVAHEINNPINVLRGNLKLMKSKCAAMQRGIRRGRLTAEERRSLEPIPQMLGDALRAAETAARTIEEFRNFARDPRAAESCDLNQAVRDAVASRRKSLGRIKVVLKLGRLPSVRCFYGQMVQVFSNLIRNAAEAMPEGGRLTVTSSAGPRRAVVQFADTGRGILRGQMKRIFEPFFTTKPEGGMGLGLPISASILNHHSGSLRATSRPGRGSVFTVQLPVPG